MLRSGDAGERCRLVTVLAAMAAMALASACEHEAGPPRHPPARTVRVSLLRVAERGLLREQDGSVRYGPAIPLGGVEVCAAEHRPAHDAFEPFERFERPICAISEADESVHLDGLPANADLVITYAKDGYQPLATTFRTDEHDVAVPSWADKPAYFVPLLPEGSVESFLEPEPALPRAEGLMAIWVIVTGEYTQGEGVRTFGSDEDPGVAQAEGVRVEIEDDRGEPVAELETRRDRPLFVRLPAGSYAVRFAHGAADLQPVGVQEQYMITGLPSAFDTIEVPVRDGQLSHAAFEIYCPLPEDQRAFSDLSTCALGPDEGGADAGAP